jgi:DNA-binding response OmpR family regulator
VTLRILVVEDGTEYSDTLGRFLGEGFTVERAGSGGTALERLRAGGVDAVFLDMRFDRLAPGELLGDLDAAADRFNGDLVQARRFLEDHQGTYILDAIRSAGVALPVLLSHDFSAEPRRWERLRARFAPVDHLPDDASPAEVRARLTRLCGP